ncbi:MAG TPA: GDSL-type esterase/lipase family protein [Vicinamibacteria bacterium]|nr:GDSL-type esterase/lipase family protein [Vicinamibacteria bacterium]
MASFSRLGAQFGLAAASILLTLLAAEGVLRLTGYAPASFQHTNRIANRGRSVLLDCYPSNPRGYFDIDLRDPATLEKYRTLGLARLDEAAGRTPYAVERRYSTQQFRSPEIGPHRPGVVRVAVIGDSFTEGMGVKEEDTYARVLHRLLNTGAEAGHWEVFNCGRRGYDFPAIRDLFESVLALEPDVVIYGMVLNDAVRAEAFQARQAYLNDWILDRGRMFRDDDERRLGPLDFRLFALVRDRVESYRVGRDTTRWYRDMYGEPNREGWERTQAYLREMNGRAEARGGRFLVASWPLLVGLEGRYPFADVSETIARFCLSAGIARHDLLSALYGHREDSLWVHPVDHHPNETAHRLAGESLVGPVRRLWTEVPVVEEEGPRALSGAARAPSPSGAAGSPAGPAARPGPSPRP